LFNNDGSRVIGLVAWRTGDGHGLAMNAAAVRSFVRGEVANVDTELPEDAIPLWQSRVRLVLVTAAGCQPCELQKRSMPDDVRYETIDIARVNAKGYNVRTTPTMMVFVDGKLEDTSSGLLRGDRLRAFLDRWGFRESDDRQDDADLSDKLNPWSNPRRWEKGPVRDRIENAKDRFAWWLPAKWLGFAGDGAAIILLWLFVAHRALRKSPDADNKGRSSSGTKKLKRTATSRPKRSSR
jgi:hypothetical protein